MIVKKAALDIVCGVTSVLPDTGQCEAAFAGKSNVGKSSLINVLMNRKSLARTSSQPGKTQTINFYHINDEMFLVDLPGYGYANASVSVKEKWGKMIEKYLYTSKGLKAVFLLVDIRHDPSKNDKLMYDWIVSRNFRPVIIATKLDKIKRSQVAKQLKAVRKYADTVRFYSTTGDLEAAYKIAHDMGFKVVGTAWLSGKNTAADKKELNGLIALCNKGYVQVACVGSETLLRGDLTSSQLIKYMKYVRKRLKKSVRAKVAVTTADDLDMLLKNDKVCKACDILAVNNYPFWGGVSVKRAAKVFADNINTIQQAYPQKEIIISETGWPTGGDTNGKAKPSAKNAAKYFSEIRAWSLKTKTVVLWFDAADEPWKETAEGSVGSHWGLMKKNFKLKSSFKKLKVFQ